MELSDTMANTTLVQSESRVHCVTYSALQRGLKLRLLEVCCVCRAPIVYVIELGVFV